MISERGKRKEERGKRKEERGKRGLMVSQIVIVLCQILILLMATFVVNRTFQEKSGGPMGIAMAGTAVCGAVLGLVLSRFLERFGWRMSYVFLGALWLCIVMLVFALFYDIDRKAPTLAAAPEAGAVVSGQEKVDGSEKDRPDGQTNVAPEGVTLREATSSVRFYLFVVPAFS